MAVDLFLRRAQIRHFVLALQAAEENCLRETGKVDNHTITHFFTRPSPADRRGWQEWIDEFEWVLIPEMQRRPGWNLLVPEVEAIFNVVSEFEPTPQWGCPLCI